MKRKKCVAAAVLCLMLLASACGGSGDNSVITGTYYNPEQKAPETERAEEETERTEEAAEERPAIGGDLFLITENDMQTECLILDQIASGKQYMYNYSLATQFLDKYGNRAMVSLFEPGRVICVGAKDSAGRLLEAQLSDQVWEYPGVTRYDVDEEHGIFRIADTNYSCAEDVFVHADGERKELSDLSALDTLRVVGIGKRILSVSVTTGHGELKLENTSLFDGSYIQIGKEIFTEITGEMTIEVPEGTYTVAVANNGYGGSTEVTVESGSETVLDLDTLKGEGPKFGRILFAVDVLDAAIQIDGKSVDYSEPVELQYGEHVLTVMADGYDPLTKRLFVNSQEATIIIGLTGEEALQTSGTESTGAGEEQTGSEEQSTEKGTETASGTEASGTEAAGTEAVAGSAAGGSAGSLAGSLAGSHSGSGADGSAGSGSGTQSGSTVPEAAGSAELDAIIDSLLDKDGDGVNDATADYLSTIIDALSGLADED